MLAHLKIALFPFKGRQKKKLFFFGENPKGGGRGSRRIQNFCKQKKLRIFWIFLPKGGGSHPIQNFCQQKNEIFGHILPKRGDFVRKNSEFFGIRGGVSANPKFLLTEKIWPSKLIGKLLASMWKQPNFTYQLHKSAVWE